MIYAPIKARMYPLHRRETIRLIRQRLKDKQPTYLVATQLIEAGVDLDFEAGYRAIAPLESIIQSAGRGNRSAEQPQATQTIFQLVGETLPPGDYRQRVAQARQELEQGTDLARFDSCDRYFNLLLSKANRDRYDIQTMRKKLQFRSAAKAFDFIEEDGRVAVVVGTQEALAILGKPSLKQVDYQRLQQYAVRLPQKIALRAEDQNGILVWNASDYINRIGIAD